MSSKERKGVIMRMYIAVRFRNGWRLFDALIGGHKRYVNLETKQINSTLRKNAIIEIEDLNNELFN